MKSKIENYLDLELNPVAIIWSNDKPEKALQLKPGKYACAMYLVAQAAKGKIAVLDAGTTGCVTAASAFGFGKFEDKWPLAMDYYYAFCQDVGLFAYQESQEKTPRAIIGLKDIFARNNLKRTIGQDKMTFTIPMKLFMAMEEDADESLLVRDTWKKLSTERA